MKSFNCSFVFAVALTAVFTSVLSSCENEEYDVSDLNTEVTIGAEGLTLPIGSTKQLSLKDMISGVDDDMLQVLEGGVYALRINDTFGLGDQLPDISSVMDIPDITFDQETVFSLSGMDKDNFIIDGQEFDYEFDVMDEGLVPEPELPVINIEHEDPMGIWKYGEAASEMAIEVKDVHLETDGLFDLPSGVLAAGTDVELGDFPEVTVDPVAVDLLIKSECPEGVSDVSDIKMTATSVVNIKLSLENSFLSKGTLVPDLVLDLSGILDLGEGGSTVTIGNDFILDETNGFVASRSYHIDEIIIDQDDWNGAELELEKSITVSGKAALKSAVADSDLISGNASGIGLRVDVEFVDLAIESLMMDVETDPVKEEMDIEITLEEIELPEGVKSIDKVIFTEESCLDLVIDLKNLGEIAGLETTLSNLVMTFPEEMGVREAEDGKVIFNNVNLIEGLNEKIHIENIVLPDPVDGKISYSAHVFLEAEMSAKGRICSADIPDTEAEDGVFVVKASSDFKMDDYIIQTEGIKHEIVMDDQILKYTLPQQISDIGSFSIVPEGEPVMAMNFALPEMSLAIETAEEGLQISFPEFLVFKDVDPAYGFDYTTNTINIKGELPEQILLPVEKFEVIPVCDSESGTYYAVGEIKVGGTMQIPSGEMTGKDVQQLTEASAAVNVIVPEIKAAELEFKRFEVGLNEVVAFTMLNTGDLPDEVKKISRVDLEDVEAVIDLKIENIPDLGVEPDVNISITLPPELVIDSTDPRLDGNKIVINSQIEDEKVDIAPIKILALDLSEHDMDSDEYIIGNIFINGSISADNPELDLSSLDGDVIIDISARIVDIKIDKISANVAYDIDDINENIKLTGLPAFMKGEGFVLDIADPHLIIKAKTNIGIPVKGKLLIEPIVSGVVREEDRIQAEIELPCCETAAEADSVVLWMGGNKSACPADYIYVNADISKLIKNIPDELRLSLEAGTDPDQTSVVEPDAKYILDVDYDFVVPLEFGKDLKIEICDTISGLPDMMGQILEKNKVQLAGSITSSLPLALEMRVEMLDDKGKVVPVETEAVQKISACNSDGSPTVSPLDLVLAIKKGTSVSGLASLKVTFKVTAPNFTGVPLDEADFVQAFLKISVPEGITLDLSESNTDDNL